MRKIFMLCTLLLCIINSCAQKTVIDVLRQEGLTKKEDTNKVKLLIRLGWKYPWSKPDSAIIYGLQARQLSHQLDFAEGDILASALLTEAFCTKGNFSTALEIDLKSLQLAEKLGIQSLINICLRSIANVYFYSGDYQNALANYIKCKDKEHNSDEQILGFIGETYFHLDKFDSALVYITKAYNMDITGTIHWSVPYYYMAAIEMKKKKYTEALENYRKGIVVSKNVNLDIVNGYSDIAALFKETNRIDSSIYYSKQAIEVAQQGALTPNLIAAAALLTELYIRTNTDSAFKYQRIMISAKDSLFSQEKIKQLESLSFNEQIRQQELQQTLEQTQLKYRNRLIVYMLLASVLLLLVVAVGLWRRNVYKQKSFTLLQIQKQEIDIQKQKIEETFDDLKATQSQLIQSEKMASLGELTAGIAHEIQNPLNFVNNFAQINTELIDEAEGAIDEGRVYELKGLLKSLKENELKINQHGQRADAIVKGMLQHSRISGGHKEPTDINSLADEYLRLSYHGFRAKDKEFSAAIKTDFDPTLSSINVIPQDIGRVLINLYNNAFYAVAEKMKQKSEVYEPTVTVTTKMVGSNVEIKVKDNGNGIAQKVLDKIFQPFFTTKPAGQGTGLGLSLSYDIVKAHGGEIKVDTKEGEYTEFTVTLPS